MTFPNLKVIWDVDFPILSDDIPILLSINNMVPNNQDITIQKRYIPIAR